MTVSITITSREDFAGGQSFGEVGVYEKLKGTVEFRVDPAEAMVSETADIEHIARDENGRIQFSAPICILKPKDPSKANRRILYEVLNRGNKHLLRFYNDGPVNPDGSFINDPILPEHAGHGFLMRRGFTIVWSGWQGDLIEGNDRMKLLLPSLTRLGSGPTGAVRAEMVAEREGIRCLPLSNNDYTESYEAVSLDTSDAELTARENGDDEPMPVARSEWAFAQLDEAGNEMPSGRHCLVKQGFKIGWIYELAYVAKNPRPLGLGFISVRELISFLKYDDVDANGTLNPLREGGVTMEYAYATGFSQSARFMREFIYRGYNADERGRRVLDGILAHVAGAGRVTLNYRFAHSIRHPRQHQDTFVASDDFPFAYPVTTDALTGKSDGILKRPDTDPCFLHTQGSAEYWERRGSLVHTDSFGRDLPDHPRSRVYLFTSAPHDPAPYPDPGDIFLRYPKNMMRTTALMRALLIALDEWVSRGIEPPSSRIPRQSDGTGVSAEEVLARFPAIPGLQKPAEANRNFVKDFGPEFDRKITPSGPRREDRTKEYKLLLPQIDEDGLETVGVPSPEVTVPLATQLGWNLRVHGAKRNVMPGVMGGTIPFALNESLRSIGGDPRRSIAARYASRDDYAGRIRMACDALVSQRLLLAEDADRFELEARNRREYFLE